MNQSQAPNFDRVARIYRWAEYATFGSALQKTRLALLSRIPLCRKALVLGDGDGRFLARLLAQHPRMSTLAVDVSNAMLALLTKRCRRKAPHAVPPTCLQASALTLTQLPPGTDLIVSHFVLDCFTQPELDQLVHSLSTNAPSGVVWLVSDFDVPTSRWWSGISALMIAVLYFSFRMATGLQVRQLPAIRRTLTTHGWTRIDRAERLGGMLYSELWQHR